MRSYNIKSKSRKKGDFIPYYRYKEFHFEPSEPLCKNNSEDEECPTFTNSLKKYLIPATPTDAFAKISERLKKMNQESVDDITLKTLEVLDIC